jgi:hypothetical protein
MDDTTIIVPALQHEAQFFFRSRSDSLHLLCWTTSYHRAFAFILLVSL